jgi:hypothetical protein
MVDSIPPVVDSVVPGLPAATAGIRGGDIVLAIDGKGLTGQEEFITRISASPGREVALELLRGGRQVRVKVVPLAAQATAANGDIVTVGRIGALVRGGVVVMRTEAMSVDGGATAFSPDSRYLASGGSNGAVRLWDARNGALALTLHGHADVDVNAVAFSQDGRWLASASRDGMVKVWIADLDASTLAEQPALARRLAPKDQFETSDDFTTRIRTAQREYFALAEARVQAARTQRERRIAESQRAVTLPAGAVLLGAYDADRKRFTLTVDGLTTEIDIAPAAARELAQRRDEVRVEAIDRLAADLVTRQRVNLQLVHPGSGQRYPVGPQIATAILTTVATSPAALEVADPRFTDADGDNRLAAGERAVLQFTLRNTGEGPGQGLRVVGTGSTAIDGLSAAIGRIEPGETKPVTLTLVGGEGLQDGTANLRIEVKEANGFHAPPLTVRVPTFAFRPPVLRVAEVGVSDAQGRAVIRTGQVVTLTLRIQNTGAGRAAGVVADVVPGTGVSLAEVPDPRRTMLRVGDLEAGAFQDIRVKAFANAEVVGRFPIEVALREGSNRFSVAARDLGLSLETPQRSVAELEVTARARPSTAAAAGAAAAPRLASELLSTIPLAKRENPDAIAVIIGNRSYQNAPSVAFAANDAAVMRQYAERALGIRPGNVIYLEDATLTNLQVIFGRQGDASGRLKDLVKPGVSEVFVFYSGHGAPDARERKAYLMPVDADARRLGLSGFSIDVLYENLAALKAKHVTVALDACFSGATGGGEMLITEASPIGIQVTDPAARFTGGAATVFAAASGQELSNWYPEQRHGLFTYFFLKGLQGSADTDRNGSVSVAEMRTWLTNPTAGVPYESRRLYGTNREQTPQVWGDGARLIRP